MIAPNITKIAVTANKGNGGGNGVLELDSAGITDLLKTDEHYAGWSVKEVNSTGALLSKLDGEGQALLPVSVATLQKIYDNSKPNTVEIKG